MANTERVRLVRCPKCLNVLPEPADVTVYKCGGCGTTLRAKIRASNGQHAAKKQVRQDSDNFSVATTVSNGVPPQNKDQALSGAAMDSSSIADAPSTEHDSNGDAMLIEKNAAEVENTENKYSVNLEGQEDTSSSMGTPAGLTQPNANGTNSDPGAAENHTVEQSTENSEIFRVIEDDGDDAEHRLNASGNNMPSDEMSKASFSMQDFEQKGAEETEHAASKKSYLVRVQSRSCDLRASINSIDFHSARTSLQSKSFKASEPLQSKIMNSVDELKDDLSELFSKPAEPKATRPYPPGPVKQDGHHTVRAAMTTSAPLAAYHPAAKHPGYATRLSRSGQVPRLPPRGLPSPRYRRHRAFPIPYHHHSMQMPMEMRPCRFECCHSCRPPCYRSCKHQEEPVATHRPPAKETKRRPPPRHHCRPVLGGAPFVICSGCLQLVLLPTDFAVPSRGTRRLRCGACSAVLSYSYRDPGRKKQPRSPFGGDEYSVDGGSEAQAEPVSYSEEYGLSFGVSHSTSTEDGRPLYVSRNSSFNTVDDEERTGRDGKLHRLLGYSSASELLRRHSPDLYESFDGRTPPPPPPNASTRAVDRKGKGICVDEGVARDGPAKRPKARSGALPFQGILKKGIHSLESLKLRP